MYVCRFRIIRYDSVKTFATEFIGQNVKLVYLLDNASELGHLSSYTTTHDAFKGMFGINHSGHFDLKDLLNMIKYSCKDGLFSSKIKWEETKNITQGGVTVRCVSIPEDEISNCNFYHNIRVDERETGIASDKQDPNGVLSGKVWQLSKVLLEAKGHSI